MAGKGNVGDHAPHLSSGWEEREGVILGHRCHIRLREQRMDLWGPHEEKLASRDKPKKKEKKERETSQTSPLAEGHLGVGAVTPSEQFSLKSMGAFLAMAPSRSSMVSS